MEKIESFKVNHLLLRAGIYVSRIDSFNGQLITTFDLRFISPNREPVIDNPALHTIEHLGATYLRNSSIKDQVIYFGPMGCRTGFYLVLFGKWTSEDIEGEILKMCDFILDFNSQIPGATAKECGNYLEHNLNTAKIYVYRYRKELGKRRFVYPE